MLQYIYFVKCPNCEDEPFDFFDEAKEFACSCMSKKPIITQVEVDRNDFGECVDSCDLGTIWSWEDVMKETDAEPAVSIFTKDDLKTLPTGDDPEFDSLDNSLDFELDEVPDNFRKPIPEGMTIEQLVEEMEENEDTVECTWCNDLFDKDQCRKEVNLGYLCSRCEAAIKSRGEKLTFEENNYWDFLDESASSTKTFDPEETIELHYDKMNVTIVTGHDQGWDDYRGGWDEYGEQDITDDFDYEVKAIDVAQVLWEDILNEETILSLPGGPEAVQCDSYYDAASIDFFSKNFDSLLKTYYNKVLDYFRAEAEEAAQEFFQAGYDGYEPDYED